MRRILSAKTIQELEYILFGREHPATVKIERGSVCVSENVRKLAAKGDSVEEVLPKIEEGIRKGNVVEVKKEDGRTVVVHKTVKTRSVQRPDYE